LVDDGAVPATVWTGKEMIVVGGQDMFRTFLSDGAAYNPSTNTWRVLPHAPHQVPGRSAAFWIGGEVIVVPTAAAATVNVGGGVAYPNGPDPRADYAPMALNPDAGTWRSLPQRDGLAQAATEIDGRVLILESDERTVSELDVRTGALRHIGLARQSNWTALGEWQAFAVAGQAVFIALSRGIDQFDAAPWIGIAVDPTTGGISEIRPPKLERPRGASLHTAGAISAPLSSRSLGGVGVASMTPNEKAPFGVRSVRQSFEYDLRDHRWHRLAAAPIFRWDPLGIQLMSFTAVPFGAVLVGKNPGLGEPVPQDPSVHSVYVRDRDQWFELPKPQIDLERVGHVSVWTGRELIVWGGALERGGDPNVADTPTNDGAVYRP
jgi:hypothetical protein